MHQNSLSRLTVACVGAALGLGVSSGSALAASGPAGHQGRAPAAAPRSNLAPSAADTSTLPSSPYFAGFAVVPSQGVSSASAWFRLPKHAACVSPNDYEDLEFGVLLTQASSPDYYPGYIENVSADVEASCSAGAGLTYQSAVNDGPGLPTGALLSPGDVVQTTVEQTASGETVATVNDLTSGASTTQETTTSPTPETEVVIGAETGPSSDFNIPTFKQVYFTHAQVGGLELNQVGATATELDQDGPVQLVPGGEPRTPSGRFTLTEKHDN
jgi:hypothetical protein